MTSRAKLHYASRGDVVWDAPALEFLGLGFFVFVFFGTRLIHITAQKDNVALFCAKKRSSLNGKVKYLKSLNLGLDPFDLLRKDRNMWARAVGKTVECTDVFI